MPSIVKEDSKEEIPLNTTLYAENKTEDVGSYRFVTVEYGPYMNKGVWHHDTSRILPLVKELVEKENISVKMKFDPTEKTWMKHGDIRIIPRVDGIFLGTKKRKIEEEVDYRVMPDGSEATEAKENEDDLLDKTVILKKKVMVEKDVAVKDYYCKRFQHNMNYPKLSSYVKKARKKIVTGFKNYDDKIKQKEAMEKSLAVADESARNASKSAEIARLNLEILSPESASQLLSEKVVPLVPDSLLHPRKAVPSRKKVKKSKKKSSHESPKADDQKENLEADDTKHTSKPDNEKEISKADEQKENSETNVRQENSEIEEQKENSEAGVQEETPKEISEEQKSSEDQSLTVEVAKENEQTVDVEEVVDPTTAVEEAAVESKPTATKVSSLEQTVALAMESLRRASKAAEVARFNFQQATAKSDDKREPHAKDGANGSAAHSSKRLPESSKSR